MPAPCRTPMRIESCGDALEYLSRLLRESQDGVGPDGNERGGERKYFSKRKRARGLLPKPARAREGVDQPAGLTPISPRVCRITSARVATVRCAYRSVMSIFRWPSVSLISCSEAPACAM